MNLDEKLEYLMQGTDYGDPSIAEAMAQELRERLIESEKTGRPLRVYCGYDPTSSDLHLGHTVSMRKLRQFQELGHDVTFLVGTFTSLIGDPSDRDKSRPLITRDQAMENARTYAEQAFRVLDREKTTVAYNDEWLSEVTLADILKVASNFTAQQILTRESFHRRMEAGEPIYLHEFLYPISQGIDAHHLNTDIQVGGTDQLYNIVTASRKVMSSYGQRPNIGILMPLLPGTDGEMKMSKSLGNYIPISSTAEDMYGKVMSIPDKVMDVYAKLVTPWKPAEIHAFEADLKAGRIHPRDAKMKLAWAITSAFYGASGANAAQNQFVALFQKGNTPDEMPEYLTDCRETLLEIMVSNGLAGSKSQARRLIDQQGVKLDGATVDDGNLIVNHECIIQVGKRHFLKVAIKK
ncbi:MAG: tyrosine--tRNA ligase [Chloroflexi bacterium]|nr:tyrosine--tRNA ligase [Chloroflexota bacterium]